MLLNEHTRHLQEHISSVRATIERGLQIGVDRLFLVEDQYALTLLEARFTFLQQLIHEINDGTLTEITDGTLSWNIRRPDLALLGAEEDTDQQKTDDRAS